MKTIDVDLSRTVRGGLVRAALWRASEQLIPGETVRAIDADEDMEFDAVVETIEDATAYLSVSWTDDRSVTPQAPANLWIDFTSGDGAVHAVRMTTAHASRTHHVPVTPTHSATSAGAYAE